MKDALLCAVVAKLPEPGTPFPAAAREAWFDMMRKAVEVAYGPCEGRPRLPAADAVAGTPGASSAAAAGFVIAPDGAAADRHGRPVDPGDIPPGAVIDDYRPQPVDPEYNPIMWKSAGAAKLPLPPGVVLQPARTPWRGGGMVNGEVTT